MIEVNTLPQTHFVPVFAVILVTLAEGRAGEPVAPTEFRHARITDA